MSNGHWIDKIPSQKLAWWIVVSKGCALVAVFVWIELSRVQWSIALVAAIIAALSLLLQFFQTWLQRRDTILDKQTKKDAQEGKS
jgi:glucan phosphoethanolaminetransferase (alkaline phosphatase superfamily)